jgi:trimethylamine:corrinoid methyltransferase-like protein
VVDRDFRRDWEAKGSLDATERAHRRAEQLIASYETHPLADDLASELESITLRAARAAGMDQLPAR